MAHSKQRPRVTPWPPGPTPTEHDLVDVLKAEGLSAYRWSNGPGDRYAVHDHTYNKVIYVVRGSITFGLPGIGETLHLQMGDRLDLPAGTSHDAVVGPQGVTCLEAHC
jgi:quercetin dioxygenase-like cupin family protein